MSVHHPVPPPRSASRASHRSAHSSRSMSTNVRRLHEALGSILTEEERGYFVKALNDYHSRRNIQQLVYNLTAILDTAEKRQLYVLLRKVIPSSDQALFWQLAQNGKQRAERSFHQEHGPRHPTETLPVRTQVYAPDAHPSNGSFSLDRRATNNRRTPEPFGKTIKVASGPPQTPFDQSSEIRKVVLQKDSAASLGFSIRGGSEHSVGIFVTQVEPGGYAERQGLKAGDQIVVCNEIPFEDMSHAEAVMVLKAARSLVLYVRSVGRVPGSFQSHQTYTWVDPQGRSVSPPPDEGKVVVHPQNGRKGNASLLKNSNEKKVTLIVEEGESLGLMIRGGKEFGLGIYITGVDPYSVAEHCNLKVGDQIVDVNNRSFLSIEHQEAVAILKSSKVMVMVIRDVKKLPYARTTVDRTQWLTGDEVSKGQDMMEKEGQRRTASDEDGDDDESYNDDGEINSLDEKPLFSRGIAGSQIMYSSMMKTQGWSMIEEQARYFLNENEKGTMMFYLKEYQNKHINLDSLVSGLFEILNTHSKFSLLTEIRSFINARDIDRYDTLVMKKEVEAMKARQRGLLEIEKDLFFGDTLSTGSHPSSASGDSRPITPPFVPEEPPPNLALNFTSSQNGLQSSSRGGGGANLFPPPPAHISDGDSKSVLNQLNLKTVTVDVHHQGEPSTQGSSKGRTFAGSSLYADSKSPSEDSGVDMALGINSARSGTGSYVSPRLTVNTSLVSPQPILSSASPKSPNADGKLDGSKLQRRLSLDSVSTEGSSPASPLESMKKLSIGSDQGIPRRISDPTHHVPRDQKKNVAHTKKASEQLYQLRTKSNDLVTSPQNSGNKYRERLTSSDLEDRDEDYDLQKSPDSDRSMSEMKPKTIFDSIKLKNKKQLLDDLQHMPMDENGNEKISLSYGPATKPRRSEGAVSTRDHNSSFDLNQSITSLKSRRSTSPAGTSGRVTPNGSIPSFTTRLQQIPSSVESSKSWEFVDININPPVRSDLIEMKKTRPNLGIAVEGGAGTRQPLPKIIKIQPGGSADNSSNLIVGHVIVSVNGRDLRGLSHQQATRIIAEEFKNKKVSSLDFLVVDSNRYKILY